jgi:hypothetical protein
MKTSQKSVTGSYEDISQKPVTGSYEDGTPQKPVTGSYESCKEILCLLVPSKGHIYDIWC